MQFKNTSGWDGRAIQQIVRRCFKFRGVDMDRCRKFTVKHTTKPKRRQKRCDKGSSSMFSGYCRYSKFNRRHNDPVDYFAKKIHLSVPKPVREVKGDDFETKEIEEDFNKESFAQVVLHEIDHLLGLKHREMMSSSELSTPDLSGIEVGKKESWDGGS